MAKKSEKSGKKVKEPVESGVKSKVSTDEVSPAKKKAKKNSPVSASDVSSKKGKKSQSSAPKKTATPAKKKTADASVPAATAVTPGTDKATKKQAKKSKKQLDSFSHVLRAASGVQLSKIDASSTPGFDGGHKAAEKLMKKTADELADLQERLYAGERHPGGRSVLLVVQGMDTSGKGGIMRHVVGLMDPQGVEITSFKAPTKEELAHPFLWRIRNALPKPGYIGVFDRSQYEDVLIARVHDLVSRPVWMRRYNQINAFESSTVSKGTTIIKVMLHIDADEQKARLTERLDNPEKHYKFNPGDLREREFWSEYQDAYQAVLDRTSTQAAPWFVVPANHKWYARLAVQQLLLEHLRALDLQWPVAEFDVDEQKKLLAQS